jgi:mannose-6-phosphate isomerase-like protein (cupin superfamily)
MCFYNGQLVLIKTGMVANFETTIMTEKIISKETAEHYLWGQDCDSWILADTVGLSVKQECMPPGTREKLHFHRKAQQFFFILRGCATFYLNDETIIVTEQKALLIKPPSKHSIANETGDSLEFLVISQPTTNNDRETIER